MRASEPPPPEWCAANRVDGRSLRYSAGRLPQPAPIRLVELAQPARPTREPLRLILDGVVIDVLDGVNDHTLARSLAVMRAW